MRQYFVLNWVRETFGTQALNQKERAARVVEEAIELAQVCDLDANDIEAISQRVFARKKGDLAQEIGGVQITLEALAEFFNHSVESCADHEFYRIMRLPQSYFNKKYEDKASAGILHFTEEEGL